MKQIRNLKASITIEAVFTLTVGIYILLFIISLAMYMYNKNALNSVIIRAGNVVQNHFECGSNLLTKTDLDLENKADISSIKPYLIGAVESGYMFAKLESIKIDDKTNQIDISVKLNQKGIVFPFINKIISQDIKIYKFTPSTDLRRNKEIHGIID